MLHPVVGAVVSDEFTEYSLTEALMDVLTVPLRLLKSLVVGAPTSPAVRLESAAETFFGEPEPCPLTPAGPSKSLAIILT